MTDVTQPKTIQVRGVTYDRTHGSPFDRGSADNYYGRRWLPHRGGVGGESGPRVEMKDLTTLEIVDYTAGYNWNEEFGDKKSYY